LTVKAGYSRIGIDEVVAMNVEFECAFKLMKELKIPKRATTIGDFMLYDTLLAGVAYKYAAGLPIARADVPTPDAESVAEVERIRGRGSLGHDDIDLLRYFDNLEKIRAIICEGAT